MCVNLLKNSLCKMSFARLLVILFSIQCVTSKINQKNRKKVQLQITLNNSYFIILNAKKPAPGKDIKIYEKNGNFKV